MAFNPLEHLMKIGRGDAGKDYLPVQYRLVWFREQCPDGTIDTEEVMVDLDREVTVEVSVWNNEKRKSEKVQKTARGYARFKAVVTDGKGGRATGTKSESAVDFPDFIEKAETGAIGRALAALGYGTQFAPEFDEEHRIVDSPVEHNATPQYLSKEDVEVLKADWKQACHIQDAKFVERWQAFKSYVNEGVMFSDERVTLALKQKMQVYIDQRKLQQKAS